MSIRFASCVFALALAPVAAFGQPTATATPAASSANPPVAAPASPAPVPPTYVRFVDAELLLGERVADPYSPNRTGPVTNSLRAEAEYKFFGRNFAEFEYRRWNPEHPDGLVTQPLTLEQAAVPARRFTEQDAIFTSSLYGIGHTYVATATIVHSGNEGGPTLHSDFGIGIERLPDPTKRASLFGSYYYYPELTGKLAEADGPWLNLRYKLQTFRLGGSLAVLPTHVFLTATFVADHYLRKEHAPSDATHTAASLGIGYHL